ncbi:MAG TPA: GNAT family N-acetyltransferase [Candidatus Latescibacteria bacterium]|nr:GNAT family N-acetyltransferase [Candidatus Latescibacterota bacterium]
MRIEVFRSGDIDELVDVWNRSLPADPISPARLEARVLLDPNFREEFCPVVREDGRMVGFALGICGEGFHFPMEPSGTRAWILAMAVEPERRGRGVGSALLEEVERRFWGAGKRDVWVASYPTAYIVPGVDERAYPEGLRFFRARGYRVASRPLAMDTSLWPPRFPEEVFRREEELASQGVEFHAYSPRWLSAFRRFLRSQVPWDWEWLALRNLARVHEGTFSSGQFVLATCGGEVVGYCQYEGEHFGPFGVAEGFRGKGIGTVLLARTLRSMAEQGLHNAWVLWTGDEAAKLYGRFGFRESRRFAILHKEL